MIFSVPTEAISLRSAGFRPQAIAEVFSFTKSSEGALLSVSGGPDPKMLTAITSENRAQTVPPTEEFDWSRSKTKRLFVQLEQKVLARIATLDEERKYEAMRRHKNKVIFADRYLTDYMEAQRVKHLADRLNELAKLLKPISLE